MKNRSPSWINVIWLLIKSRIFSLFFSYSFSSFLANINYNGTNLHYSARKLNSQTPSLVSLDTGVRDETPMATLWHFPRKIEKERPRPPRVWTSERLEGSQLEIRVSSEHGWASGIRPQSKGLGLEERKQLKGLERVGESWQRRGVREGEGGGRGTSGDGSGRRWNTNMRIKAVEGIKAYNRGADLSGLRLSACLSVYSTVLRVIRTCVRQRILVALWTSSCRVRFLSATGISETS